ncbi:sensor histidine kinase [Streptomyces sp. NBC_00503]|uniref:sensor histidine kinase n=1 Tax=Streptomyces sp. NBC_00503 TaxID=2903659 RepID=UPI002E7FB5E0|nr:HAMP domain-containing sensor histidine kinase [Streptomyces sp. NBC_00503]WUD79558.1 HAMP domain-containing histidine kinase [Streptomyces sp. NBC_00503]
MIRQLIVSYVLLVAVALAAFTVPVAFTLTAQLREDTEESVHREAATMALLLAADDLPSHRALATLAGAYRDQTPGVADVVTADHGAVTPLPLPPAPGDPAFDRALEGRASTHWGPAEALGGADGLVTTVPARTSDGRVVGAVRISYPTADLNARLWRIWGFRAFLALGVLAVAAAIGAMFARRLTRPLRQLNDMATKFSDGDLTARSPVTGPPETQTLAQTLNTGAERLDTLLRAQRIFVADASHQLRTPLTALRLSLDNIADGTDDDLVREDVDQAIGEVARMSRMVNGLLVLARAEARHSAAEPVAVGELVAERLDVWRAVGDERGVRFAARPVDERLGVLTSAGHLEQVLDNVLSNALEVSPDGAAVTVRVVQDGECVVLTVADEGPGMSGADQARAFDRFWRGQGLTGRGGSGLGLAIVKQLVMDDGGSVALADAPGGGLCVRISLRQAAPRSGG